MALEVPNLDDRRFQELLDEARRLIPRYCPQWTDHNLSDPGITLLELFATLVETMIFRLNRVPEKSYITFLRLMGVELEAPSAARTGLTFWLSQPLDAADSTPVVIPADTEVTTVQSSTEAAISFSTDTNREVRTPHLVACMTSRDDRSFTPHASALAEDADDPFPVFGATPQPGDSVYVVNEHDLSGYVLQLTLSGPIKGYGVNPKDAPILWEGWCEDGWHKAEIARDDTGGLNKEGQVLLHLPQSMVPRQWGQVHGYWVRCQLIQHRQGQRTYSESPQIQSIRAAALGITIDSTHSTTITNEVVGRSNGLPGQSFRLEYRPVLPRRPDEQIVVLFDGKRQQWFEKETFATSRPNDTHFTLDNISGEVCFGPRIREPDGSERQYGAIPKLGSQIVFANYRTGGGAIGNVGKKTLTVLKSTLRYVDHVENRENATGGLDAETLERAKLRAPQMLRTRERAVTADDFEFLAKAAQQGVRRAKCLQPTDANANGQPAANTVRLLLVPAIEPEDREITRDKLMLDDKDAMVKGVKDYLDERRLLTTRLSIDAPTYIEVTVEASIKIRREEQKTIVQEEAKRRLERFLNPLVGGPDNDGWPFGRDLYISEVYAILQNTPGVEYIKDVRLLLAGSPETHVLINVPSDGLIISGDHAIRLATA